MNEKYKKKKLKDKNCIEYTNFNIIITILQFIRTKWHDPQHKQIHYNIAKHKERYYEDEFKIDLEGVLFENEI